MKLRRFALLLALLAPLAAACSPGYVLRAGWEEFKILRRRTPIAWLVADSTVHPETRRKLLLVLDARAFARDSLRLAAGDSYTLFSRVESDTLAMVISAAHKDQFRAHTWWFPIVGRVPYKGYFDIEDARKEQRKLEEEGFDTYLRPTGAFSTLGWFNDPLLSTLLRYDDVSLANTVIHEIFHNTIYVSGQAPFNESLANFVGGRGAIDFFCGREGPEAPRCREAEAAWDDDLLFGAFLTELVGELEAVYGNAELSRDEKLAAREEVFARAKERYAAEVRPRLQVSSFDRFLSEQLNNATIISRRIYYDRLELFEQVYRSRGNDLRRAIADMVQAARANRADPYAAVQALLE